MSNDYKKDDYNSIKELMNYPQILEKRIDFFEDTSQISVPEDPIEKVIFQDRAKWAIRKIAQNRGDMLMVGKPGTGKSMLANMFKVVLERSLGDYLRPKQAILGYMGKDRNHIRFAYENPDEIDNLISKINQEIESAKGKVKKFSLSDETRTISRLKKLLLLITGISAAAGFFFPPAFIFTGLAGMGAIFMYIQENNHRVQEKIQTEARRDKGSSLKHLDDMVPEILYDPRENSDLMAIVSEPSSRNMKGGFRHDPYQSGSLQTPIHKRAYLGAHAKSPIIYIDELKTLVRAGYMSSLLEIMQNKEYVLEGGSETGSGAADRSENSLKADNIILACCNHDTLGFLQKEGDGAFLSRIENRGEIIQMESEVRETPENIRQVVQYIKQEIEQLEREFEKAWGEVKENEGSEGVRKRSEEIFGKSLPPDYNLQAREFSRSAVLEIIKELRCRASDGKLSSILRPINGIIKTAEFEAILDNSRLVQPVHVRRALTEHLSLEGALTRDVIENKKDLKRYISSLTDSIGYVVGLAVFKSESSGKMYGQPLPIHCQVNTGNADTVTVPGKTGEIAKAAAQNVRASIKRIFKKIGAPAVGLEMHVEYIQAHGGVEGDSASVAMDVGLISDYIKQPVNQKYGITGSLTGDIVLAVGGVTEKIRSIMDPLLEMEGACIPWQNRHDIEPLLINMEYEYIQKDEVPGIRIFGIEGRKLPFDIYFCKAKYHIYQIVMGLSREEVENRMAERSKMDSAILHNTTNTTKGMETISTDNY